MTSQTWSPSFPCWPAPVVTADVQQYRWHSGGDDFLRFQGLQEMGLGQACDILGSQQN
jgi:hypothetical protein